MFGSSSRDEFLRNLIRDEDEEDTHYTKGCLLFRDQLRKAYVFPELSFRKNQNTWYESILSKRNLQLELPIETLKRLKRLEG